MEALVLRSLRFSTESWRLGLARWRERAGERRRLRAAQRELAGLGQHELNDLGVGRSELPYWLAGSCSDAHAWCRPAAGPRALSSSWTRKS